MSVHSTHCCPSHGCKYSEEDCPVVAGTEAPTYPQNNGCERCAEDAVWLERVEQARRSKQQEGFVVQYRVKGRSQKEWGAWANVAYAPPTADHAIRYVERQREIPATNRVDIEWRALKVTTEVLT